ncbi:MAG TPA: autotransporter-associated beta strand repeat-containing protein [Verrucomicrobiae bacterium]|nr:autotransporter-associated beta strand repeat-containing protein [Verrucomicrobiae bacterium]
MNTTTRHLKLNKILVAACLAVLFAASAHAATWNGGVMSYNTPSNWSGGQVPSTTVLGNAVNNAGLASIVQVNPGDPDWVLGDQDILLGSVAGGYGSYVQDGPNVTLNFWFRMGLGGADSGGYADVRAGTLQVNGRLIISEGGPCIFESTNTGVVNVGGELWVGQGFGGNGTMNLSGNSRLTVNNWLAIGRDNSTGVVNLSGNASITKLGGGNITFAGIGAGTGTLNQNGGAVTNETSETWLSENGTGFWNMTNGVASLGLLRFGAAGGPGTLNLAGGTMMVNQINMGNGSGTLNFIGGTLMARAANPNFMSDASGFLMGDAIIDSQGFNIGISSSLADSGGGNLVKRGTGTLTLTGPNSYAGASIVAVGKLVVETSSFVTSPVVVSNAAGFGINVISPDGQYSSSSVNLAGAATLDFALGGNAVPTPTAAPLNVTGTLNVGGTTTVNLSANSLTVGSIPLIKYSTRTGSGTFVLGALPAGVSATLVTNAGLGQIELNITSTSVIRWGGEVSGVWDINTTANWSNFVDGASAKYTEGAAVYFNDQTVGTTAVSLGVTVNPGAVTVANEALSYSLTGAGAISGTASLTKQGTGTFTLGTVNSYTGPTILNGGTLSIATIANGGVPSPIGSSSANASSLVFGGGTLSYTGPSVVTDRGYTLNPGNSTLDAQNDVTFNGALNSFLNGNFAKAGNGTLYVRRLGNNTLSSGGGGGAYSIVNGRVVMDGTAGAQVNSISGELWAGATEASTNGASLVLSNTTLNVSSWLSIGRGTGLNSATSSVALYNSSLRSGNGSISYDNNIAGGTQAGFLTLNGTSTYTNSGDGNFGESSGGTAIITLNDSSVMFNNQRLQLGWHNGLSGPATGVVTVANSAKIIVNAWMSIGNEGGSGSVFLKDNGYLSCTDLNLCDVNDGTAELLARDNSVINAALTFVGKGPGSTAVLTLTNNASLTSGNFILGGSNPDQTPTAGPSTGTAYLSGGTLSVPLVKGQPANGSTTTFNFNGGKLVSRPPYSGPNLVFDLQTANVLSGGAIIEINNNDVRAIPQPLLDGGGGGGLTKLGTGTLLLDGVNTYTGDTVVAAGRLGGIGTIAGNVTVQSGGTITAGGAPGVGQLTIGGNLTIAGNVAVEVDTTLSPSNDVIAVTGTLSKTGAGTLTVANLGPALTAGQQFFVFNKPVSGGASLTISGGGVAWQNNLAVDGSITVLTGEAPTFDPASVATLPDGNKSVTATGTIGSTYKLYATTNVMLTPIPTTWTLLSSGTVTTSPFTINDLTATNFPRRFYIFSAP